MTAEPQGGRPAGDDRKGGTSRSQARLAADLERLETWTTWLDSKYRVPHTGIHVGIDPLVGLVPVAGDLASAAVSVYLLTIARRLGASWALVGKMAVNVAADALLGMIPFAGFLLDLFYRANTQNLKLLIEDLQRRQPRQTSGSRDAHPPPGV